MQPTAEIQAPPSLASVLRPELPESALYGLPGRVARELSEATGADPAAVLVTFLTMFGNAAGGQPHVEFGGAPQPGRLFTLVVGEAASGRKGTAYEAVEELFRRVDPDWADSRVMFGLQSAEAMISRVAGDSSDPRLMIVETEFGRLVQVMGRSGNLSAQLRNAWDGRTLQRVVTSRSKSQEAKGAHVSILGMITPGELLRLLKQMRNSGGLESRILYCFSAPTTTVEVSPFQAGYNSARLAETVKAAVAVSRAAVMAQTDPVSAWLCSERGRQPHAKLPVSDTISAGWLTLVRKQLPKVNKSLGPFFSRAETHVIRLAACYAMADQQAVISPAHVNAALGLWEFCAHSAERIFGIPVGDLPPVVDPKHSARAARHLYDRYPRWVRPEEAQAVLGPGVTTKTAEAVLRHLVGTGVAEEGADEASACFRLWILST